MVITVVLDFLPFAAVPSPLLMLFWVGFVGLLCFGFFFCYCFALFFFFLFGLLFVRLVVFFQGEFSGFTRFCSLSFCSASTSFPLLFFSGLPCLVAL